MRLWASGQAIKQHNPRNWTPPTGRIWYARHLRGDVWPWARQLATYKRPVHPPSAGYTARLALQLSPAPGNALAELPAEDGSKVPTQVGALSLGSTVPMPTAVCVCKQGEQRGRLRVGRNSTGPDGNKLLLTGHWQQPEVVWTTVSKGFLIGGITGCTHIVRSQTWPSIQMQMEPDCYPGYYWEVHSGNQILTWLQLSWSNAMNTVLNIIGNPAKDNRTTHVLSYGSPQVLPGNLSSTQEDYSYQKKLSTDTVRGTGFNQSLNIHFTNTLQENMKYYALKVYKAHE